MDFSITERDWWKDLQTKFAADVGAMKDFVQLRERRESVRVQILELLVRFQQGGITTEQMRATFDKKTRTEWNNFGLKGLSGAMFLNMLVKHLSGEPDLPAQLRQVLAAPPNEAAAKAQMKSFHDFLAQKIADGKTTRQRTPLARISFFVSAFWHMQDVQNWPIHYVSGRHLLQQRGLYVPVDDVVDDYLRFRDCYRSLMQTLNIDSWRLEKICIYEMEHKASPPPPKPPVTSTVGNGNDPPNADDEIAHAQVQWFLGTIGQRLGYKVWIASNDHKRQWNGKPLGELSVLSLPNLNMGNQVQKIVSLIDVVWLKGFNQVAAAFEVEHSTSVYSGLLRMSDLTISVPNLTFPLFIVAPAVRLDKVRNELSRPSFQWLQLHQQCGFFSSELLMQKADAIIEWATDVSKIEQLAEYVPDAKLGEDE